MTIKVYKRQNNWFFTYKCDEYQFIDEIETFVDCLGQLLKKDIIYFETDDSAPFLWLYLWRLNSGIVEFKLIGNFAGLVFNLFQKQGLKRTIILPRKWLPDIVPSFIGLKIK